jgi:3-phosphoshikimate 1-carboxyvinyltransferase
MKVRITPGPIAGSIAAPPSKSMTQRVYAAALLHDGKTIVRNAGNSADEQAALSVIKALGAVVDEQPGCTTITGNGINPATGALHHTADVIDCGESGLAARLFTSIAAMSHRPVTITGSGTLLKRSMHGITHILPQLGVEVTAQHGCLPITLNGRLIPSNITIDGSESSQFVSGLLFAYSFMPGQPVHTIRVHNLKSKPYVDMTLYVLRRYGLDMNHEGHHTFYIGSDSSNAEGKDVDMTIEGDWSSAACFLVAGAIAGSVSVAGLTDSGIQADSALLPLLQTVGASVEWNNGILTVKQDKLQAFEFDASDSPDLFPVLAVLAACCEGESYIAGLSRLFHKESNRAASIGEMLLSFGAPFSMENDTLCVTGVRSLRGGIVDSYHDHRIVMAAAIGALRARGPVDILHAGSVGKSYPAFFDDLASCGVVVDS